MAPVTAPPEPGSPTPRHPAWIEVDVGALTHNARVLRRALPDGAGLGILVKANGYGHGMLRAARAALAGGADELVVANLAEGLALRADGIDATILVVYPIPADGIAAAASAGLDLTLSGRDAVEPFLEAWRVARDAGAAETLRLHVEVDSGMARGGVPPDALRDVVRAIDATPGATLAGVWSHLADGRDVALSAAQATAFESATDVLVNAGRPMPARHLVASEALFAATAPTYDLARIGLAFYGELGVGFEAAPALADLAAELRPAMTVKAIPVRVESVATGGAVGYGGEWIAERPSRVATLPIGYADGWSRRSWPGGTALVRGRRVPVVGRVSMDSLCVDVTDVPDLRPGDEFVLLGGQGEDRITATEVAVQRGTIPNEVLSALGTRLPRVPVGRTDP